MKGEIVKHKIVADVMTRDVVSVRLDTPMRDVVNALGDHGVSGVPVLDMRRHVVGVVTEADLMVEQAAVGGVVGPAMRHRLQRQAVTGAMARTAAELMTSPAVTLEPGARLTAAAATMARRGVKRLPVVDDDQQLIGIISRRDVLSVYRRSDAELAEDIRSEVLRMTIRTTSDQVRAEVVDGVVTLRGTVPHRMLIAIVIALTEAIEGVVDVRNELIAADAVGSSQNAS